MRSIVLTQLKSLAKIAIWPTNFIIHKPRKIHLSTGKPAFRNTTLMSVFNPDYLQFIVEPYEIVKRTIFELSSDFAELVHAQTGTSFIIHPSFWELSEPSAFFPDGGLENQNYSKITSIFNPILWVPIEESFSEAYDKMSV